VSGDALGRAAYKPLVKPQGRARQLAGRSRKVAQTRHLHSAPRARVLSTARVAIPPSAAIDSAGVDATAALIALVVGFGGVVLGALLTRRNERRSRADDLLAQALNDAIAAIADVATGTSVDAQARYASAVSRVALHALPEVVQSWRHFQDDATTETDDGRARLVAALQSARVQLGHGHAAEADLRVLLFGPGEPKRLA
jgi:hypothetical protein